MRPNTKPISTNELIVLLAMMISIVALSTDIMLAALDIMGRDLGVANLNDTQFIISFLFLGFAAGQVVAGPVSDSFGRKPVIYIGYAIFIFGCILSIFATNYAIMLVGRILQGLGAACPRIVSIALIRDGYEGRAMARIMSIVMAVFIVVPAVAPAIGQGITAFYNWRAMFTFLMIMAVISVTWFALRQPETLAVDQRRKFSLSNTWSGIVEACQYRRAIGYTVAAGLIFGAFLGYLSSAQQIFQISYTTGNYFPLYFGAASLAIGASSILNSRLVMRFGMRLLTHRALIGTTVMSTIFLILVVTFDGVPPFWSFMLWLLANFFCMGIMFGNFNALAMEPLGHMAGLGAAFVGSLSTFISLPLAWLVGSSFDGGVTPLVGGFAFFGFCSLVVMYWTERGSLR